LFEQVAVHIGALSKDLQLDVAAKMTGGIAGGPAKPGGNFGERSHAAEVLPLRAIAARIQRWSQTGE